ncbi:hypothetical protein CIK97_05895 [Prevotella sp. P3-120]|uniref:lipopolysaccharide biosynthesis protein n=1 Tax=unclassified Prevotella TaxID=2638335 RepID=UPI000B96BAB6|nr:MULTISPECIES: oligosaccharide flippase family protein [unclassified Prevotella]OYP50545.1 hypothetical protein CIK97_05895 [Prevotella sp. P3-120]OYP51109.1 hypothetical protein CIK93_06100 [Prevotella sp. P3-92]
MLKKSIWVVLIQFIGVLLSFVTLYFIVGDMTPEVYSLVGTYTVILGVVNTFSHLGIETVMMRETLYWTEHNDTQKVVEYATQSMFSRIFGYIILLPLLLIYIFYIDYTKYDHQYLFLLFMFLIGALASTLNDCMSLIVRSKGGYVFAQFAKTLNNSIVKTFGLILYLKFGAAVYLYFFSLSSVPLFILFYLYVHKSFSSNFIQFKPMLKKVWESRFLWLRTDLDYFKNYADSILVSILFPAHIMGIYSLYKALENMAKDFIEGFFDVLSQNLVRFKGNYERLCKEEKKYNMIRAAILGVVVIVGVVFAIYSSQIISICNLSNYDHAAELVQCVFIVAIIYILGKYEINILAFFASSKLNFNLTVLISVISIAAFGALYFIPSLYGALFQRIIVYLTTTVLSIALFKKYRTEVYTRLFK